MHRFTLNAPVDVDELRERLRKMSDEQLRRFGRAAQFMCSPGREWQPATAGSASSFSSRRPR